MFEQMNAQVLNASKQFADAAFKAQGIAFQGFEQAVNLQVKAAADRFNATLDFIGGAAEVTSMDNVKSFLPKGAELVRETAEQTYATSQELMNVGIKTSEALSSLLKGQFEVASEGFTKPTVAARKAKA